MFDLRDVLFSFLVPIDILSQESDFVRRWLLSLFVERVYHPSGSHVI